MNEQQFASKMEKDGTRVKKAFTTLISDGASQFKDEYDQFTGTVQDTANDTISTIKKNVGYGVKQYNSKLQDVADKFAGGFGTNVRKYPWVVITLGLVIGFVLGFILKPSRQSLLSE